MTDFAHLYNANGSPNKAAWYKDSIYVIDTNGEAIYPDNVILAVAEETEAHLFSGGEAMKIDRRIFNSHYEIVGFGEELPDGTLKEPTGPYQSIARSWEPTAELREPTPINVTAYTGGLSGLMHTFEAKPDVLTEHITRLTQALSGNDNIPLIFYNNQKDPEQDGKANLSAEMSIAKILQSLPEDTVITKYDPDRHLRYESGPDALAFGMHIRPNLEDGVTAGDLLRSYRPFIERIATRTTPMDRCLDDLIEVCEVYQEEEYTAEMDRGIRRLNDQRGTLSAAPAPETAPVFEPA